MYPQEAQAFKYDTDAHHQPRVSHTNTHIIRGSDLKRIKGIKAAAEAGGCLCFHLVAKEINSSVLLLGLSSPASTQPVRVNHSPTDEATMQRPERCSEVIGHRLGKRQCGGVSRFGGTQHHNDTAITRLERGSGKFRRGATAG